MWVSVEDRLPESSVPVLAAVDGEVKVLIYAKDHFKVLEDDGRIEAFLPPGWWGKEGWNGDYYAELCEVTHWMPLPEAPGGAE